MMLKFFSILVRYVFCDSHLVGTFGEVAGITGGSTMVDKNEDGLPFYKWDIVTKYYTATVNVCHLMEKTLVGRVFAANVEAVVIYSDSNNVSFPNYQWVLCLTRFH